MSNKKGQTLIEVMVAIAIFVLVMVSIVSLISVGKNVGNLSIQKMMAENYVQEGMEKVRNIRDYNLKNSRDFGFNLYSGDGNYVVSNDDPIGSFKLDSGADQDLTQGFKRIINVVREGGNADILKVTVIVNWNDGTKKVEATEFLTNWKQ